LYFVQFSFGCLAGPCALTGETNQRFTSFFSRRRFIRHSSVTFTLQSAAHYMPGMGEGSRSKWTKPWNSFKGPEAVVKEQ